jgi:hypothetical protein
MKYGSRASIIFLSRSIIPAGASLIAVRPVPAKEGQQLPLSSGTQPGDASLSVWHLLSFTGLSCMFHNLVRSLL